MQLETFNFFRQGLAVQGKHLKYLILFINQTDPEVMEFKVLKLENKS